MLLLAYRAEGAYTYSKGQGSECFMHTRISPEYAIGSIALPIAIG